MQIIEQLDAGHFALLAVIILQYVGRLVGAWMERSERDKITNKMLALAGEGTLDNYVRGASSLKKTHQKELTDKERLEIVEQWHEEDEIPVS